MKKILSTIKYTLIVTTMILLIVFQKNLTYAFYIVSVFCSIMGILLLIEKNRLGLLLEIFSIDSFISVIVYKKGILSFASSITLFISAFLAMALLVSVIYVFITNNIINKIYTRKEKAKVIDYEKYPNSKKKYLMPIYQYRIKNKEYIVKYPSYLKNKIPKIDSECTLLVNPKDVEDVYFPVTKTKKITIILSGVFVIIICLIVIISLFT